MDLYDGPIRGGTRGGAAEFKWTDVSADKDRENYLGHSINAPTGRWQKSQDVHWYSRDAKDTDLARAEEIRRIKAAEADLLDIQLGYKTAPKAGEVSNVPVTAIPLPDDHPLAQADVAEGAEKRLAREEKARRKEEKRARKEEKHARKEEKREHKERRRAERDEGRKRSRSRSPHRRHSRSRSPRRDRDRPRDVDRRPQRGDRDDRDLRRSRSPPHIRADDRTPPYNARSRGTDSRDNHATERERERGGQRWGRNARGDQPSDSREARV